MDTEPKIACRTPTDGKGGVTNIPAWKYDCVRRAVLHAVEAAGPDGLAFGALVPEVRKRLSDHDLRRLGSLGWHVTTVKLNMEVEGEIMRAPGVNPQRIVVPAR